MISRAPSSTGKKQPNWRFVGFHSHSLCFSQPLWGCSILKPSPFTTLLAQALLTTFSWALVRELLVIFLWAVPLLFEPGVWTGLPPAEGMFCVFLLAAEVNSWGSLSPTLACFLTNHFWRWFCSNPYAISIAKTLYDWLHRKCNLLSLSDIEQRALFASSTSYLLCILPMSLGSLGNTHSFDP